jgi:hypothetical protein
MLVLIFLHPSEPTKVYHFGGITHIIRQYGKKIYSVIYCVSSGIFSTLSYPRYQVLLNSNRIGLLPQEFRGCLESLLPELLSKKCVHLVSYPTRNVVNKLAEKVLVF